MVNPSERIEDIHVMDKGKQKPRKVKEKKNKKGEETNSTTKNTFTETPIG